MNDLSVGPSVQCIEENGGSDPDTVWHHRSDGSGGEAGGGVWGSVHGKGYFLEANLGRAIVINGDFTALVCDSASTVGAAVWGGACGGLRHCCIRWAPRHTRERGRFGGFVPHFHTLGRRR